MEEERMWGDLIDQALHDALAVSMPSGRERVRCSAAHYERMRQILGVRVRTVRTHHVQRMVLVGLLAALLLTCSCAMAVYGAEIGQLILERFPNRIEMTYPQQAESAQAAVRYLPGCVPSGYACVAEDEGSGYAKYVRENGDWFRFEQDDKQHVIYTADTDMTVEASVTLADHAVEVFLVDGLHLYTWSTATDSFRIVSSRAMSAQELELLIGNLVPAENKYN